MSATQEHREIEITTPLGKDVLLLRNMTVTEELGRLFIIDLELNSSKHIRFEDLLGQMVSLRLNIAGGKRFFNGYVGSISQALDRGRYAVYRATVHPRIWFLTRQSNCRIFQQQTVPDIVKDIFKKIGYTDIKDNLRGSYRTLDYCVQYRETDFNFISRLFEQEGIYYYFIHEENKHTLVLADDYTSHEPIPGYKEIPFYRPNDRAAQEQCISSWYLSKQIQPGVYALNEYDFIKPKADLAVNSSISQGHSESEHEIYDYPGEYVEKGDGNNYAQKRIEELHTRYEQVQGNSMVRGLLCGGLFKLAEYPREDQNREYLVCSVSHSIRVESFEASGEGGTHYTNSFTVIDSKTPFRPARITPKPIVQGPQTAKVVGPAGDEIYTDEHGRVKLQFHWDRYGKSNENSSCWVRVSQLWAGKTWGGIHIPRIGQEVIVEFLEGDPDQPIITGRVYNGDQTPPYALPANKTQSGIKSRSSQGGSGANFNEIRMEDKKGAEQLYIHAEKNQDNIVENDETTSVGHDRTEDVGHDEKITIGNNRTEKVGVNEDITIGSNRTETVGANESITIVSNRTKSVGASETVSVALQRTHTVGINETIGIGAAQEIGIGAFQAVGIGAYQTVNVGAYQSINVGANQSTDVGANQSLTVGGNQSEAVTGNASKSVKGNDSLGVDGNRSADVKGDDSLKVGKNLVIDAGDSVTIKTGSASITMKKDGTITIKGKDITVDGSGKINATASNNITMKGQKILQN
ncbi:Rhs-family protein [Candidatus Methylobacter favarea]|uniref:Rhs-family protein n=1 Tax=Candidatus Methylobacter favarea TaxID=2707345 RepID=A0A8S0Y961_9GAMM|nr:type VI secretion system Vgr family protein [Candidatus Methylobacter favarea]CAA9889676.1 Rhs-family protein [Candidatus Methylobacter favarea]